MDDRPPTISELDFISDAGLTAIEALVPLLPQDFSLGHVQATATSIQINLHFTKRDDVQRRADSVHPMIEAAMCIDALCKNLRAERAARRSGPSR